MKYYAIFLAGMSLIAFIFYGIDKSKAKHNRWRIKEATLLLLGFCGGAAGALLGMHLFHHKTRKWYFHAVNLLGLAWQAAAFLLPWQNFKVH